MFISSSGYERGELDGAALRRPVPPLEQHSPVLDPGLPLESLALTTTPEQIVGSHRGAAWHIILEHVQANARPAVVAAMLEVLAAWQRYRDDVAHACGLTREQCSGRVRARSCPTRYNGAARCVLAPA